MLKFRNLKRLFFFFSFSIGKLTEKNSLIIKKNNEGRKVMFTLEKEIINNFFLKSIIPFKYSFSSTLKKKRKINSRAIPTVRLEPDLVS